MREHRHRDGLDVVGRQELTSVGKRPRLGDAEQRDSRARAGPEVQTRVRARRPQQRHRVAVQALLDVDPLRLVGERDRVLRVGDRLQRFQRWVARLLGQHPRLLGKGRIPDLEPHREPVELRLGQRIRALVFDRVLRRHDHERPPELVALAVDRDLLLLHALEERRLRLWGRAVDLVDEQEVGEDRSGPELELVRALVEDVHAGHVRRQQVRCELQPREGHVERARQRLRQHRLADAGEVLEDQMSLGGEAEHAEAQRLLGRVQYAAEVRHDGVDRAGRLARAQGLRFAHAVAPRLSLRSRRRFGLWAPSGFAPPPPVRRGRLRCRKRRSRCRRAQRR